MNTSIERLKVFVSTLGLLAAISGCAANSSSSTCATCEGPYWNFLGALCGYIDRCPTAAYPIAYRSHTECMQILHFLLTCSLEDNEVNDVHHYTVKEKDAGFNSAKGEACIAWLNAASCDALDQSLECDSDSNCDEALVSPCAEVIKPLQDDDDRAGLNESCESRQCKEGFYCTASTYLPDMGAMSCPVCKAHLTEGEPCTGGVPCASGLYCATTDATTYQCAALKADEEECTYYMECLSQFCNPDTKVCDPKGHLGDACSVKDEPGDAQTVVLSLTGAPATNTLPGDWQGASSQVNNEMRRPYSVV